MQVVGSVGLAGKDAGPVVDVGGGAAHGRTLDGSPSLPDGLTGLGHEQVANGWMPTTSHGQAWPQSGHGGIDQGIRLLVTGPRAVPRNPLRTTDSHGRGSLMGV